MVFDAAVPPAGASEEPKGFDDDGSLGLGGCTWGGGGQVQMGFPCASFW